jgi:hypothetical protein
MLSADKMNVFMLCSSSFYFLRGFVGGSRIPRSWARALHPNLVRRSCAGSARSVRTADRPRGGSSVVHQAGRTSGRFLGKPAMTERSRLSVSATISIGLRAMDERGIEPHVRVFDKSERTDGTYSRSDLCWSPFL